MRNYYRITTMVVLIAAVLGVFAAGQAQADLLVHYKMDAIYNDGTDDKIADYSTYGSDGTMVDSSSGSGTYSIVSGVIGNAMQTDTYTSLSASNTVAAQLNDDFTNFTYAFWAKPDETTPTGSWDFIGKAGGGVDKYGWAYRENTLFGTRLLYNGLNYGGTGLHKAWNPTANPELYASGGMFTHIASTFDGTQTGISTAKLYINGMLYAMTDPGGTAPDYVDGENDCDFRVGSTNGNQGFPGAIDDVGVWNTTLGDQQIALTHGLGRFVGVDLGSSEIGDVLDAFLAGAGNSAVAGGYEWEYTSGLSGVVGEINNGALVNPNVYVANGSAYIVLDASGNGMLIGEAVPEPSTLMLMASGLLGLLAYAWRKRK